MHFSISTFDYLIIKINGTKGIVDKVDEINNFFSTISEDNSYPAIISVSYNNEQNNINKVCNVYDSIAYNKINFIVQKNNGIENTDYIAFNLIQSNEIENVDVMDDLYQLNTTDNKFKFSNVADILDIIGSSAQFSFCDNLYMNNINELKFYELNGKIVLEVEFC
jgi:hypothetical protein